MDTYENEPRTTENTEGPIPEMVSAPESQDPQTAKPQPDPGWTAPPPYGAPGYAQQPYYGYYPPYPYQAPSYRQNTSTPGFPPAAPKKKEGGKVGKTILSAALVVALVVCSCGFTAKRINDHWKEQNELLSLSLNDKIRALEEQIQEDPNSSTGTSTSGTPNTGIDGGMTPAQVYAQNVGSVVAIECSVATNSFGQTVQGTSSGSGFVLTEDGYIVSNYHVVDGATNLKVIFSDGAEYTAKYVGGDGSNDISLLKIEASGLRPVTVGRSDTLIVGDQVAAIGNPLGELASTLTVGYISAKDRVISTDGSQINMIQTDAAINSGNSGGPLFNMNGEVIGITTAKYSGTSSSGASIEGIGFAIPIDDVIDMLEDLRQYGYITGAYLGVSVSNMDKTDADLYGLPVGVLVREVTSGSCAQLGGIRSQDIIVELGGYEIGTINDLTRALRKFKAGDTISVTVYRHSEGGQVLLSVTLDEKPRSATVKPTEEATAPSSGSADDWFDHFFG